MLAAIQSTTVQWSRRWLTRGGQYPGLEYIGDPYRAPVVLRTEEYFAGVHGLRVAYRQWPQQPDGELAIYCGERYSWRSTAKLAVRSVNGAPTVGMFRAGTHELLECLDHPAHAAPINEALQAVSGALRRAGVAGYDERDGSGDVKFVVVRRAGDSGRAELSLVWNTALPRRQHVVEAVLGELQAAQRLWHSVWLHWHDGSKDDSAVYSYKPDTWSHRHGSRYVHRPLLWADQPLLHFLPSVFQQANLPGFERVVASIRRRLLPGARRLVELYAGVGMIGLNLLDRVGQSLVCSDENPDNADCFARSLSTLPADLAARASYVPLSAAAMVATDAFSAAPVDVLVVNPPRKGLDPQVVDYLAARNRPDRHLPSQLVYVSCSLRSLRRDLAALHDSWLVAHAEGHLLFPGADHIELLVILARR